MDTILIIAFVIIFLGFMIALFLALRGYGKAKGIKHYEKVRDELSVRREKPKKKEKESSGFGFSLPNLIGGFVAIMVGVALVPEIGRAVQETQINATTTISPAAQTVLSMLPVFFAIGIALIAISTVWSAFRNSGVI